LAPYENKVEEDGEEAPKLIRTELESILNICCHWITDSH
jgi:hypothetical protein